MILLEISFLRHYFSIAVERSSDPHPTRGLTNPYARARGGLASVYGGAECSTPTRARGAGGYLAVQQDSGSLEARESESNYLGKRE